MPLLDGQPVDLPAKPSARELQQQQQQQGWQIRFTGEEFADYDQYLDRLSLYRKPIWTCAATGQNTLTYEQALLSERASSHRKTGVGFSDMLICEMLTFLSQSTMSIALAVDALYYRFQYDFFGGEHIDVKYPDTNGAMYECFVVDMGPLPEDIPAESFEETAAQTATRLSIERLGDGAPYIIAYEQRKHRMYTVRLYDVDGIPIDDSDITVPASELSRSRNMFTKVALRQFLDDNMRRDPRPGSPWIVGAQWRDRFRIPYMYGGEARLLKSTRIGRHRPHPQDITAVPTVPVVVDPYADERDLAVKPYRKIPIDDLDYLQFKHVRYGQGIVWAMRRKQQKLMNGKDPVSDKAHGKGTTHQITEYFPTKHRDSEVICINADEPAKVEDEEEDEDLKNRWPVPLCEWQVPLPLVSRTLSVYMFISCFSVPLALNPYPLDYFESALVHGLPATQASEDTKMCSVYRETIVALLNSLIDDRKRNAVPSNVSARIEAMVSRQDATLGDTGEMDVDGSDNENENAPAIEEPKPTKKALLPPVAPPPAVGTRTRGKQAATRSSGRLQRSSMLSTSSSIASSDNSDSDRSDGESVASAESRGKRRGGGRALPATRSSRRVVASRNGGGSSAVSSRAASPVEEEEEAEAGVLSDDLAKLAVVGGHALLRRLSRTWAGRAVDKARTHWAGVLAGWLVEASHDYAAELAPITQALWGMAGVTLGTLEAALCGVLDSAEARLLVVELLASECASNERMRAYLDECGEQAAELKRERLECRRELKRAAEALAELDRGEQPVAVGSEFSRDASRREAEAGALRQKERRRLGETERTQARRLDYVERELRRLNVGRLTPLGADRFFTRYFFIDGVGGCPATGAGSGRILVHPAARAEQNDALDLLPHFVANAWALALPAAWSGALPLRGAEAQTLAPLVDTWQPIVADMPALARAGELWGYYATGPQVDALRRWLDPRGGKREAALAAELELLQPSISASIRRRCQYLEQAHAAGEKARQALADQIASADDVEIKPVDATPQLLPPAILVDRVARHDARSMAATNDDDADASSTRASSAEPITVVAQRPARGRKPKNRQPRVKTYMDDFLAYENILSNS
ncbi:hypothetical protein FBU31_002806 [Coemansia sp. 'formosensis']|nr:hypothetical protein FBU31_002806 [Coemansia sp. 'formosensis']